MARACPACNRPNSDAAERCLYCSKPLPPPAKHPDTETSASADRFLLILIPGGEPDGEKLGAFSRITEIGLYEARQCLVARRPRLFQILRDESRARELSASLGAVGIPHFTVSERAVRSIPISVAHHIQLNELHLTMTHGRERPLSLPYEELLVIVRGEIRRERHDERRLGSARGVSRRLSSGERLHLYSREATVAIEVDPEAFDWGVLGEARTTSALLNVEKLLSKIAAKAPVVVIDRGFADEPAVLARAREGEDPTHSLIGAHRGTGEGVLYDNETQFRFYARWRYRLQEFMSRHPRSVGEGDGGMYGSPGAAGG